MFAPAHVAATLVIGIGNPSRGDDALGPLAVERLATLGLRDCDLLTDFQLQVEHALDLVGRKQVVFVDATLADDAPSFRLSAIEPKADDSITSHALSPAALLHTYRKVSDAPMPRASLLAIRGYRFELGARPTPAALRNLDAALERLVCALGT